MCEAMSNNVITPGVTTTADVSWWMWQKSIELGFECWFQPSFGVQVRRRNHAHAYSMLTVQSPPAVSQLLRKADTLHLTDHMRAIVRAHPHSNRLSARV
jgi:hypothetical protein